MPRVRIMMGYIKNLMIGLIKLFIIPKMAPMMSMYHHFPWKLIPGIVLTARIMARALIVHCKRSGLMEYLNMVTPSKENLAH